MEMCGATWYKDGASYICNHLRGHKDSHHFEFHWTNASSYAQPNYKDLYSEYIKVNQDLARTNVELENKVQNQAKSLTEMHKRIKRDKSRIAMLKGLKLQLSSQYGKGLDYYAKVKETDSLRKELADLRENFAYNENSWRESNEYLKKQVEIHAKDVEWLRNYRIPEIRKELETANETIADYKTVIKLKTEALDRATELLRKVRRFIRDVGL